MKPGVAQCKEILKEAEALGLYEKLLLQLRKEFELANVKIDLEPEGRSQVLTPDKLISRLKEKIYLLIMERFTDYLNLMYVADIPETAFKNIEVTDTVEIAEQLTYLILQRDLQKVLLKKKYDS